MTWDEMNAAVTEARQAVLLSDRMLGGLARLLSGRLRQSDILPFILNDLKRELVHWNSHTNKWTAKP